MEPLACKCLSPGLEQSPEPARLYSENNPGSFNQNRELKDGVPIYLHYPRKHWPIDSINTCTFYVEDDIWVLAENHSVWVSNNQVSTSYVAEKQEATPIQSPKSYV